MFHDLGKQHLQESGLLFRVLISFLFFCFYRTSFLKMWQVGLHLSLAQLSKKDAVLEQFNSTVVWHGSLVFNKVGVMIIT